MRRRSDHPQPNPPTNEPGPPSIDELLAEGSQRLQTSRRMIAELDYRLEATRGLADRTR